MKNKYTFFVHSKRDALFLINSLDEIQLPLLNLNCVTSDGHVYGIWYDGNSNCVLTTCNPFYVDIRESILDTFKFIIDAYYPDSL